ncbi:hypothetical protein TW65_08198 [Stemphylium lycopersici]|uniref:Uncharacterized protein n=1 Tax=Stemphylium lycopersici TaxID=183478 RepID=A0A364NGI6_STELY|nr:hypothetical protein TW65_08198 [Stemphylium lycopersici]RAR16408.1 hypothetical protein DDE83_000281 [Stemphylium lycopersici]
MCPVQAVAGSASAVWCRRQLVVMVPSTSYTRCAPLRDAPRALTIALKAYLTEWCDPPLPSTSTSYERANIAKCTPSSPVHSPLSPLGIAAEGHPTCHARTMPARLVAR